ncbi:MAG TPA: hypothetical protein PJ986_01670 [Gammaproteobacteria bacterium]|nr:hypothetical protein [Gammaproteobacteria bacterium]
MSPGDGHGGDAAGSTLAIVYATFAEAEPLLTALAARPLTGRPYAAFVATPGTGSVPVVVAITGMGLAAATTGVDAVIAYERPQGLLNAGIAGALHEAHAIGAVLRIGAVAECNDDALAAHAFHPIDAAAMAWLPPTAPRVRLVSRTAPLFDARLRDRLARSADLVDMEGARVAARCAQAGVPCALLKAVSDHATDRATLLANLAEGARRLADHLAPPLRRAC